MKKLIATILFLFVGFNTIAQTPKLSPKQQIKNRIDSLSDTLSFSQIEDKIYELNTEKVWHNVPGRWFFGVAGLFAIISLIIMLQGIKVKEGKLVQPTKISLWDGVIYAIWIVAPPLWFLFEYVWMFDDKYKMHSDYNNDVRLVQELASKVWGALFVLFGSVLYLKYAYKRNN